MKTTAILFGLLSFIIGQKAPAQIVRYDSVALEPPLVLNLGAIQDTEFMFENADGLSSHFTFDGECTARFRVPGINGFITMQKGETVHFYWKMNSFMPGDSNIGRIHFQNLDTNFKQYEDIPYVIYEGRDTGVEKMETFTVPDTGLNAIGIEIATDTGGTSFWLDAVVLVQSGAAGVSAQGSNAAPLIQCYPNPFYAASGARIEVTPSEAGTGELSVSDALGREIERISLGELSGTAIDSYLSMHHSGLYFVRLMVNGRSVGAPIEISAE